MRGPSATPQLTKNAAGAAGLGSQVAGAEGRTHTGDVLQSSRREGRTTLGSTLGEILMLEEPLALAMAGYYHELLKAARRRQAEKGQGHAESSC
jgi:hypothetical protein